MTQKTDKQLVVALDIGTSKVIAIVGELTKEGHLEILGVGACPSKGLKRGIVVNIEATIQSIQYAIREAELVAGCRIHSVYTGIAGSHINSLNSHGIVAIHHAEVTQSDIDRVVDAAKAVPLPADQKIIHVLPQQFSIDNHPGIKDPLGMTGVRLEADVHIVTGSVAAAQNIVKCVRAAGLEVDDIILEQLASSYSVLTDDEKELGVCLVDIGGGTTDIAVFAEGVIQHTAVIPIAGDQVTNDVAVAFRTSSTFAETIKINHGCALKRLVNANETFETPASTGERPYKKASRLNLSEVIEPRYEELFFMVKEILEQAGLLPTLGAGIVLTGGSSKIIGATDLAEEVFHLPVRLGSPKHTTYTAKDIANPIYATAVGLLLYGQQRQQDRFTHPSSLMDLMPGVWNRMKGWFQGRF